MSHPNSRIPEPGTYGRVLRRYDRHPRHAHQMRFASYDVNLRAVAADMQGTVAMTLFFPVGRETAADRACKFGWVECTEMWNAWLGRPAGPNTPAERVAAMDWNTLLSFAAANGVDHSGKRNLVAARVADFLRAQTAA